MIYGQLKEKNETGAVYYVVSTIEDMSGEVQIFKDGSLPVLIKEADNNEIIPVFVKKLYAKYNKEFDKGEFREKISYEC